MSTRSEVAARREDSVVRVLALGAVALLLGGALGSVQRAPADSVPATTGTVGRLPAYVVAPAVVVDAVPGPHRAAGVPVRVTVPDLDVSAPVVGIALDDRTLVPPADPHRLGWWVGGAKPGALHGSAVVTGHTVSSGGGALDRLGDLERGDRVTVRTDAGRIRYRVTDVVDYRKPDLAEAADEVFSQVVPGRLVLVTCTGFDGREYHANTVVFAAPLG